jgi:hypothetical protein
MKKIYLLLILSFCITLQGFAQIAIDPKGTRILVDSSKWKFSGVNIYNKNTGNVGIGNTNPTYKLDVTGKFRVSDSLIANSAQITSLLSGSTSDSVVVANPTTGLLKRINASSLSALAMKYTDTAAMLLPYMRDADTTSMLTNYINAANNGLTKSGKTVQLGGNLTSATTITNNSNTLTFATGGSALNITGLTAGATTDSLLTINTTTGKINRVTSSILNKNDSTTASNGLNLVGKDVRLGGALTGATSITTTGTNTLAITGLTSGSITTDSLMVSTAAGVVKQVSANQLNKIDSTTANNGLTLTGKNIQLGGNLTSATTITNNTNTLTFATAGSALNITGLTAGATTDSLLTINTTTGKINRVTSSILNKNDSTTASNGLNLVGKDVRLGGALTGATSITATGTNTLAISGLQSGSTNDSLVVSDATTGVLRRITTSTFSGWSLTGNSGTTPGTNFIGTKDNVDLVFKINSVESGRLNLFNLSTTFGYSSLAGYKSTAIGYSATTTTNSEAVAVGNSATATYQSVSVGSNATTTANSAIAVGNGATAAYQSTAIGANTSATGNNSTVIGFGATTSQANALILGGTGVKVGIGTSTPLNALDVNAASNPLKLSGLVSGATTDSVLTINTSGVVRSINFNSLASGSVKYTDTAAMLVPYMRDGDTTGMLTNYINAASNGLTKSGKTVQLGGALTAATTITTTGTNTLSITGLTSGSVATDSFMVATSAGVVKQVSLNQLNKKDSTTASNGLTLVNKDVQLGGSLTKKDTITTSATNTLAIAGLQSGSITTDSILVANGTSNAIARISVNQLNPISGLLPATKTNSIDNTTFGQTWTWTGLGTSSGLTLNANSNTSTNGIFSVANTAASGTGIVARIQSNSTAGTGVTVLANGNVGVGNSAPASVTSTTNNTPTSASTNTLAVNGTVDAPIYASPVQALGSKTGSFTWDVSLGANASVTLTGNGTLALSNQKKGMYGLIIVSQDATGGRTLTLPAGSKVINGGAGAATLTTTGSASDILTFYYDGTNYWWTIGNNYN